MIGLHIISDFKNVNFSNLKVDENILKHLLKENIKSV
jgi:hypothetical protein